MTKHCVWSSNTWCRCLFLVVSKGIVKDICINKFHFETSQQSYNHKNIRSFFYQLNLGESKSSDTAFVTIICRPLATLLGSSAEKSMTVIHRVVRRKRNQCIFRNYDNIFVWSIFLLELRSILCPVFK